MADCSRWTALLLAALTWLAPATAAADWYVTPFAGVKFGGSTTLVDLAAAAGNTKLTIGGSLALITDGALGVEAEYALSPGYFQNDDPESVVQSSHVQTLTANLILAAPLSWTRESLRPYVVGGVGWMRATSTDILSEALVDTTLLALNLGVGAVGMLGDRTGLRFDVRRFSNLDRDTPSGTSFGTARLSFWRATIGVTLRY